MGRPAKRTRGDSPGRATENDGKRWGPPAISTTETCADVLAMSASSSRICADPGVASSDATSSTGCVMRSRYAPNWAFRLASSMRGLSDLADEVQRRGERLRAFVPLGRADFTRVRGDVLRGLHAAQRLLRVAADAVVVHFDRLDAALGVDHERAAQREARVFAF